MCVFVYIYGRTSDGSDLASVEDQVVKKLEQFNSVCDELYKEIVRCRCCCCCCLPCMRFLFACCASADLACLFVYRIFQLRRKEKLLNLMEKSPKNVDLHRQIQTAGNMVQVIGDFRHFLETGVVKPDKSS